MRLLPRLVCVGLAAAGLVQGGGLAGAAGGSASGGGGLVPADKLRRSNLKPFSLKPPYLDLSSSWWTFGGDAVVDTRRYIRLTANRMSQSGWVWTRLPLLEGSFEIEWAFAIHGPAGELCGDGMALWLTRQPGTPGPVFGMNDRFEGLGVFIDTYRNGRKDTVFPYIMAMFGDGHTSYDLDNDGQASELAGCSVEDFYNRETPVTARLTYLIGHYLRLQIGVETDAPKVCFHLTNFTLPFRPFLGISATTGDIYANHDLLRVDTYTLTVDGEDRDELAQRVNPVNDVGGKTGAQRVVSNERSRPSKRTSTAGGFMTFFWRLILAAVLMGALYAFYTVYRVKRRSNRMPILRY